MPEKSRKRPAKDKRRESPRPDRDDFNERKSRRNVLSRVYRRPNIDPHTAREFEQKFKLNAGKSRKKPQ